MTLSWYSTDICWRINCATGGVLHSRNEIAHPVHTWNDDQMTCGRLASCSSAAATSGTPIELTPINAAVAEQNLRNSRLVTPTNGDPSTADEARVGMSVTS